MKKQVPQLKNMSKREEDDLGDPTIGGKQVCYSAKEGPMSSRNLVIFLVRI